MLIGTRHVTLTVLLMSAALPALLGTACGSDGSEQTSVTGRVTNVVSASVTVVSELDLVDATGVIWRFGARGFVGMTPSHLEEHGATGEPVTIEYLEEGGRLIITHVTDG